MKCIKCGSENLEIVDSGPHKKLICADCMAFQRFMKKSEAKNFLQLRHKKSRLED